MDSLNPASPLFGQSRDLQSKLSTASAADSSTGQSNGILSSCVWKCSDKTRSAFFIAGSVVTCGILYVVAIANPDVRSSMTKTPCPPNKADFVFTKIYDEFGKLQRASSVVRRVEVDGKLVLFAEIGCKRYYASEDTRWSLVQLEECPRGFVQQCLMPIMNEPMIEKYRILYGKNRMELPPTSITDILITQLISPFFIFQYFSIILWCYENYIAFSMVILAITVGAIYTNTMEQWYNLARLRDMAGKTSEVIVLTSKGEKEVPDDSLTPGDRFLIKEEMSMPCDAVVFQGRVVVDESMLTGESAPISKTPFDILEKKGEEIDALKHSGHILFSGTKVRKVTPGAIAVVYRTGFRSAKGQLVASLLVTKEDSLGFFSDAMYVIVFMFFLASFLYLWASHYLKDLGASDSLLVIKWLDSITIAVPPGLTTCLIVATSIAVKRLASKSVFVSETSRVNWAGTIQVACFDKTGTLTTDELRFDGVTLPKDVPGYPENAAVICEELMATCNSLSIVNGTAVGDPLEIELYLASCWTLYEESGVMMASTASKKPFQGRLATMLAASGDIAPRSSTVTSGSDGQYQIIKHFEFSSDKLRAGTLLRRPSGTLVYLVKGSPEIIMKIAVDSSIPKDIKTTLMSLVRKGLRVLAFAYCDIAPVDLHRARDMSQEELESGSIRFLGLVSLRNNLKIETCSTIESLSRAFIRTKMITGDHIFTGIAVATECKIIERGLPVIVVDADNSGKVILIDGQSEDVIATMTLSGILGHMETSTMNTKLTVVNPIVDPTNTMVASLPIDVSSLGRIELAVSGQGLKAVRQTQPHLLCGLIKHCKVFARTKPQDKKFVVDLLMQGLEAIQLGDTKIDDMYSEKKFQVLFCGDGANDMAALRSATVGVSLCDSETSIAAPITSRLQTPGSVVDVLKEGRCSLITAYVLVNFNIMYGVIQLFMALLCYTYGLTIGDYIFLMHDLFFTLVLGLCISMSPPADILSKELPPLRFFCPELICKLFSQLICFPLFQFLSLQMLQSQSWYVKFQSGTVADLEDLAKYSDENSVLSFIGLWQLMIASIVASIDQPFRKPWYKNQYHLLAFLGQFSFLMYIMFAPNDSFLKDIQIKPLDSGFCGLLLLLVLANLVCSLLLNWLSSKVRFLFPDREKTI